MSRLPSSANAVGLGILHKPARISFVSAGRMTLRMLGVGGAFSRRYGTTCSVLELRSGKRWLIDCGRQAPDQLWDAGLTWHEIEGQVVTHVHGDHTFGLEDFAFMRFYESRSGVKPVVAGGPRPAMITHSAVEDEIWQSLAPSLRYFKQGDDNTAGTLQTYFDVRKAEAHEPPGENPWNAAETFEHGGLRIVTRETEHVPGKPSFCLEIGVDESGDKIAWWSGDSTVDQERLVSLEPRTTVFFHDCTFTDYPGQVHGAFKLLKELPEAVRRKVVLMHHEDNVESHHAEIDALGFRMAKPGDVWDLETGQKA